MCSSRREAVLPEKERDRERDRDYIYIYRERERQRKTERSVGLPLVSRCKSFGINLPSESA